MGKFRTTAREGFSSASDAVWDAFEDLRSGFDRKVGTRMGRGDVRAAILALLSEEPMHGYQIIREVATRTEGRWKPSAGSVYPTLQQLADEGLVTAELVEDRKVYSLTAEARDEAAEAAAEAPWAVSEDDEAGEGRFSPIFKAGIELGQAVTHAARTGSSEQQSEIASLLDDTRRRIYSILAQG